MIGRLVAVWQDAMSVGEDGQRSLSLRITVIARMLRTQFDHSASNRGITRAQWRILATVAQDPGATQRAIAKTMEIGEVTAGRLIDRLCDEGWIVRQQDARDRRAHRVYVTAAAKPVLELLGELGRLQETRAFKGVSADELAVLSSVLDRVARNLAG